MPIVSAAYLLVGTELAVPAIAPSGGVQYDVVSVALDFACRAGVGDCLYRLDGVSGVLTDIYVNPDDTLAPHAGWSLEIRDPSGNVLHNIASLDSALSAHETGLEIGVAGSIYVNALSMHASAAKRAKVTLVFM